MTLLDNVFDEIPMPSQLKAIQRGGWLMRALNRRRTAKRLLRYSHVSSNGSPLFMLRHLYCVSSTTCKLCSPSFLFSCRLREKLSERARESSEFSRARKGLGLASSAFKLSLFKKSATCQSPFPLNTHSTTKTLTFSPHVCRNQNHFLHSLLSCSH